MNWKLSADKDGAVRAWMKAKGIKVEDTEWVSRQQVRLWIHYPVRCAPLVLGISHEVLTGTPAFAIQELLERLNAPRSFALALPYHLDTLKVAAAPTEWDEWLPRMHPDWPNHDYRFSPDAPKDLTTALHSRFFNAWGIISLKVGQRGWHP